MNCDEYKKLVIKLFQDSMASARQWDELGESLFRSSEQGDLPLIDKEILPYEEYEETYNYAMGIGENDMKSSGGKKNDY